MVIDPISDFLIQLSNGGKAGKEVVTMPASNLKQAVAETLVRHGWLSSVVKRGKKVKKFLTCELVYVAGKPKITAVKRISKSSRRVYAGVNDIKSVRQGFGLTVLSTPKGVLTDKEARQAKVGGEVLFEIY